MTFPRVPANEKENHIVSNLNSNQTEYLLRDLNPRRVKVLDGMSHLEAFDVRATLIRVFGFGGWSETSYMPTTLLYEVETTTKSGKPAYRVAYIAHRRLTVDLGDTGFATYEGSAVGESLMPDFKRGDAHDMAIKTAESQALKRCAINLGTQFGLSLYRDGDTRDVVGMILAGSESDGEPRSDDKGTETPPDAVDAAVAVLAEHGMVDEMLEKADA